jgi:transposase
MGRSRGGLTAKIHALVDANGLPIAIKLTEGQAHDGRSAADLLHGLAAGQIRLADRAYDSNALRETMTAQGAWANIKPMPHRFHPPAFSPFLYRYRNRVERFFNRLKHYRAIATRYEKHATNYLAAVKLAAVRIWLRHYESVTWSTPPLVTIRRLICLVAVERSSTTSAGTFGSAQPTAITTFSGEAAQALPLGWQGSRTTWPDGYPGSKHEVHGVAATIMLPPQSRNASRKPSASRCKAGVSRKGMLARNFSTVNPGSTASSARPAATA